MSLDAKMLAVSVSLMFAGSFVTASLQVLLVEGTWYKGSPKPWPGTNIRRPAGKGTTFLA